MVGNVGVRFGGGINMLLVSATDGAGRVVSIDLRTGGSGGTGLLSAILFLKSLSSRRGGRPGFSSGESKGDRARGDMVFLID